MKNNDVARVQELIAGGQFQDALGCLDALSPEESADVSRAVFRGIVCQELGRGDEAESSYRQAINFGLKNVTLAWKNLAVMFYCAGRYAEAVDLIEAYRDWQPDESDAIEIQGNALLEQKKYAEAERLFLDWLEKHPDDPTVLLLLQYVLQTAHRHFEALSIVPKARYGEDLPPLPFLEKIFGTLLDLGWVEIAEQLLEVYLASVGPDAPHSPAILWTMSSVAFEKGDYPLAVRHLGTMLGRFALTSTTRYNLSMRLLALGNLESGWQLYRLRDEGATTLIWDDQIPKWSGEALDGKSILVFSEQGAGDVIQFLRFVPLLEKRRIRCTFVTYEDIVGLLAAAPDAELRGKVDISSVSFDYQLQLMDLALVFGVKTPADIPAEVPYLSAPKAAVAYWQDRLAALPGTKVGLIWAGNPEYGNDHWRSSSLLELSWLAAVPGITWVALQKGPAAGEDAPEGLNLIRLGSELTDYADTAAVIEALDLVVSVDTSVAHLAGALGKPVWIMLPLRGKDWRWFLEEHSSPWYPSARLFTQSKAGRWDLLIRDQLRPALAAWLLDQQRGGAAAQWQLQLLHFFAQGGTASSSASVADGLPAEQLSELLPFARSLAVADQDSGLLDAIWERAGPAGRLVWAECAARLGKGRAEALAILRESHRAGETFSAARLCAYVFALVENGDIDGAQQIMREARDRFPEQAAIKYVASQLAEKTGNRSLAIRRLNEVIEQNPRWAEAHRRLYDLHRAAGNVRGALVHLERAVLLVPSDWSLLRFVAREMRFANYGWLSAFLHECLCRLDGTPLHQLARAADLAMRGYAEPARELLASIPDDVEQNDVAVVYTRLMVLRGLGDWPAVLDGWQRVLRVRPGDKGALFGYGWDLLSLGRMEGWQSYAQGLDDRQQQSAIPLWDGVERHGSRLLVYQDQGQGDLLQFFVLVRTLPASMRVTLAVNGSMKRLLQVQNLPCTIIGTSEVDWLGDEYHYRVPLMVLPSLIGTDLQSAPRDSYPYLIADSRQLPRWRLRMAQDARLKVGVVWAGNPTYGNDVFRSTLLKDWRPLLKVAGLGLYNLQKDSSSNQALSLPEFDFANIVADCDSWQKTAAAVSLLDLVISVDSGVLHLAGCLGIEAWGLLPHTGTDFRWLQNREDCPWYPSMTMIRQQKGESWEAVLQRVAERLVTTKPGLHWQD